MSNDITAVNAVLLILRVTVGGTFIAHGYHHWRGGGGVKGTASWFENLGLRHGALQAWASVLTEIGAGVLLVAGLFTPLAAAAVVSVMLVAFVIWHRRNGFFILKEGWEYVAVLAVTGLTLGTLGAGEWSLDQALGLRHDLYGWAGLWIALGVGVASTGLLLVGTYRPAKRED
ncbi:DoxX family protein [Streptomyces sp. NPDC001027]|uniref:DoxX family protein n=1 Tax=Streptomyces sp. NPDC001027 TaxID=3154771 RepID=UPI0033290660